ncbi:MAG: hypothetical protein R3284_09940 [Rubricoccaceae bacterium]|nr:hypothetical protein [Rubricoccaceae bacterium]
MFYDKIKKEKAGSTLCKSLVPEEFEKAYDKVRLALLKETLTDPAVALSDLGRASKPASILAQPPREAIEALTKAVRELPKKEDVDLNIVTRASVTPHFLPDMTQVYTINYQEMRKATKATDYSVEKYANGTLKSVNVMIDDQTGDVIKGTLAGAINLAKIAVGIPPVAVPQAGVPELLSFEEWKKKFPDRVTTEQLCNEVTRGHLARRANYVKEVATLPNEIKAVTEQVSKAKKALEAKTKEAADTKAQRDKLTPGDENWKNLDESTKKLEAVVAELKTKFTALESKLKSRQESLSGIQQRYAEMRKHLVVSRTVHYSAAGAGDKVEIDGARDAVDKWFNKGKLSDVCKRPELECDAMGTPKTLLTWATAYLAPSNPPATTAPDGDNLIYREPARGLLMVCKHSECLDSAGKLAAKPENVVFSQVVDFPQLGVLAALPLVNKAFQNNTLTANFSESGSLTKLGYVSNARAARAAKTVEESSEALLQYAAARREADTKRMETAKAEVDAETELIKARLELEKAQAALDAFLAGEPLPEEGGEEEGDGEGEDGTGSDDQGDGS